MDTANVTVNSDRRFSVYRLWRGLQQVLLPSHCLLCAGRAAGGQDLCMACADDLLRNTVCCPRCAVPLRAPAPLCGECLRREPAFAAAWAPFVYAHPTDLLLTRLKFGRNLAAGRVLAQQWLDAGRRRHEPLPQLLVPVPLHLGRLRERGYNQALELARPLAQDLNIALDRHVLVRSRATQAQSNLDAAARRRNLRGAFAVRAAATLPKHVAVVDDVMTTGATLRECAHTLRRAGVARVEAWALARAPR